MPSKRLVLSAESVTCGQSNKLCDLIVDTILDRVLAHDRFARVDLDAVAAPGMVLVAGELTPKSYVDITGVVREVVADAGYDNPEIAFHAKSIAVFNVLQEQSSEVALAVDRRGAGNQCVTIGYATNEAKHAGLDTQLMPLPIVAAHRLARRLYEARVGGEVPGLHPDGQVQTTFLYDDAVPLRLLNATVSAQHSAAVDEKRICEGIMESVIKPVVAGLGGIDVRKAELLVNNAGRFVAGGPSSDVGVSGRSMIMDLYGAAAPSGGAALSGKDPTKTDRAATYMARHIAKCVVAADLADRCEVRLAYLFGREEPVSVQVNTFGTGRRGVDKDLAEAIMRTFDLTTPGIVEYLDLRKVKYAPICCFGCVGREGAPWEDVGAAAKLREALPDGKGAAS